MMRRLINLILTFLRSEGPAIRITLQFRYDPHLIRAVKAIPGAKWHGYAGGPKVWSIPLTTRKHGL